MKDFNNLPLMYHELAHLWPLISAPEDYAEEARHWREALVEKLGAGEHEILELGVGGGNNLSHILRPAKGDNRDNDTGSERVFSKSPLGRGFRGGLVEDKNTPRPSATPLKRGNDDYTQKVHHNADLSGKARSDLFDSSAVTFRATAVDLSEKMLANCRRLNPEVELQVGDMRSVRLGRKFSAVLIHDAISYMTSEADLRAVFATAAEHLKPGGVFITTPDHFEESFTDDAVHHNTRSDCRTTLSLVQYSYRPDRSRSFYETLMFYIIREGDQVRVEQERHRLGLFPIATWLRLLDEAGFEVERRPYDVHDDHHEAYLFVGVLR